MAIQQADIIDGNIVFTNIDPYKINPGSELEGNTTANTYSIGSSGTIPLQIKSTGASNTGWTDEQDMVIYGVSITTSAPVLSVGATVTTQLVTLSITTGTAVGLYGAGSWASGPSMSQSKSEFAMAGSLNATVIAGGTTGSLSSVTELFNGSAWITGNAASQSKSDISGAGSQNAAIMTGSSATSITEVFNGSNWTTSGNFTTANISQYGIFGSQNATQVVGGVISAARTSNTVTFNGSTWTTITGATLPATATLMGACGSANAGMYAGGFNAARNSFSAIFNGSTWNLGGNLTQSKQQLGTNGTQNSALVSGGSPDNVVAFSTSELFNGSSWIVSGNMTQSRVGNAGAGSQNSTLVSGAGSVISVSAVSETHTQTLYRALTWDHLRCASNIGVATNISGNTCNVKLQGFVQNMSISSTAGNYLVVTRNSSTTTSTASFQVFKTVPDAEDWIIGVTQTVTTNLSVMNAPILPFDEIKNWG